MEGVVDSSRLSVAFDRQETESKKSATWRHLDTMIFFSIACFKICSTWINHLPFLGCLTHLSFNFSRRGFCIFCFRWIRRRFFKLSCKSCAVLLLKFFIQVLDNTIGFILQRLHTTSPNFCVFLMWITFFRGKIGKTSLKSSWWATMTVKHAMLSFSLFWVVPWCNTECSQEVMFLDRISFTKTLNIWSNILETFKTFVRNTWIRRVTIENLLVHLCLSGWKNW